MDYTQTEDYDCPDCSWSLHVEKRVWDEVDDHSLVIAYIESQVFKHSQNHRVQKELYPIDKDITTYKDSPYVGYTESDESSLIILE